MTSLVQRLLTAVVLIPVVVWLTMYSADTVFVFVLSVIIFIAGYEWASLSGLKNKLSQYFLALTTLIFAHGLTFINEVFLMTFFYVGLIFWLLVIALIIINPKFLLEIKIQRNMLLILGHSVIGSMFISLYQIRLGFIQGPDLLMYLLLLIWIADSGAYFSGRIFGKHKLSPFISPGKSLEGVVGGLFACLLFSLFAMNYFNIENNLIFLLMSIFVAIVSVFGDLFESLIKRRANVKDSGSILPGHGGILDRIDSLIAAAPVFIACVLITQVFA